eukprot:7367643-Prymnesium_polylepis.1
MHGHGRAEVVHAAQGHTRVELARARAPARAHERTRALSAFSAGFLGDADRAVHRGGGRRDAQH